MSDDIEWYTPQHIIDALVQSSSADGIILDPCWSPNSNVKPAIAYTKHDDGLSRDWSVAGNGLIFVNPPYGRAHNRKWSDKIVVEGVAADKRGGQLVALLPCSTGSKWWQNIADQCDEILFLCGRIRFIGRKNISPSFDSCLMSFGCDDYTWGRAMRAYGAEGVAVYT